MPTTDYLLDACAVLAFFDDEKGADIVSGLIDKANHGEVNLYMNAANLLEVYYDRIRVIGEENAYDIIRKVYEDSPINIIENLSFDIVREAAYFKSIGKMSFADTILVATAICIGATIVTCDHIELGPIEQQENIPFLWIRPKS